MRNAVSLGLIFGIRVRLHYTWSIAFVLIAAVVVTQFPEAYPLWQRILLGLAAGFLFFVAIIIREFFLNFVSVSRAVPVKVVTLFAFGGVSEVTKEDTLPAIERLLVVVGLLSNLVIFAAFYALHLVLVKTGDIVAAGLVQWLAYVYSLLTVLHFIPGFPLDGGRMLRVLLWRVTGDYDQATRLASWVGWSIGLLFILGGIVLLIMERQWFSGATLVFMGWALQSAASLSRRQAVLRGAIQGIMARDIMARECPLITAQLNLRQLVQDCILVTAQRYFVVAENQELQGAVTIRDIKRIRKRRWDSVAVGEIMTPASELKIAHAEQSALSVLEQMDESGIDYMPVLEEDKVIGVVARDSLIRLGRTRVELGA